MPQGRCRVNTDPTPEQVARDVAEDVQDILRPGETRNAKAANRLARDIFAEPDREQPEPFCEATGPMGGW